MNLALILAHTGDAFLPKPVRISDRLVHPLAQLSRFRVLRLSHHVGVSMSYDHRNALVLSISGKSLQFMLERSADQQSLIKGFK